MIAIRKARIDEVKKLQDLNDDAFSSNPMLDPDLVLDWAQSDLGKTYFINTINNPRDLLLVAEDEEKLVGYIGASPKEIEYRNSKYLEVDNLGVAKAYRRKGVATLLMEKCIAWAKEYGYQKLYLTSYFKNTGAITFYKQSGFSEINISLEKKL